MIVQQNFSFVVISLGGHLQLRLSYDEARKRGDPP